jgi:hypothetical protein
MGFLQRPNKDIKFHNSYFFWIKLGFVTWKEAQKSIYKILKKNHMQIIIY